VDSKRGVAVEGVGSLLYVTAAGCHILLECCCIKTAH